MWFGKPLAGELIAQAVSSLNMCFQLSHLCPICRAISGCTGMVYAMAGVSSKTSDDQAQLSMSAVSERPGCNPELSDPTWLVSAVVVLGRSWSLIRKEDLRQEVL